MATGLDTGIVRDSVSVLITSLSDWPSIAVPTFGTTASDYLPTVRTEFEGNYVQSRLRTTRARRQWSLKWNVMTETDYQTLRAFFLSYQGSAFNWIEPVTSTPYVCRFSNDTLTSTHIDKGAEHYRSVELNIEEV